jgi:hypothetical protein
MGARAKLNGLYALGCVGLAALIGGATQSWGNLLIALAVLMAAAVHSGDIRPKPGHRPSDIAL